MKKILLFSRDPGGANTIIPLVKPLMTKGYEVALWGKDISLNKYQAVGLKGKNILDSLSQLSIQRVRDFLSVESPDLIITATSAEDFCEKYIWKAAEELGIVSFVILDQWVNYGIRFSNYPCSQVVEFQNKKEFMYLPSKILLMDELAKRDAISDGLPAERMMITGQPHLQAIAEKKRMSKDEISLIRNSFGVSGEDVFIVFASEPITETFGTAIPPYGYTEQGILKELICQLQRIAQEADQKVVLVIRPHPREFREKFNGLSSLPNSRLKVIVSSEYDSDKLIEAADCLCGMSSMFLLESAVIGKPIISIQIGLKGESLFVLDRNGMNKSVRDCEELSCVLKKIVINKEFQQPGLSFIKDPISRIIAQVDEYFNQKKVMR